jgi:UDP-3-O-[3-hydroxymyristoyl] N-acetylglucosamine deacetylase
MTFSEMFGRSERQQTLAAPVQVAGRTLHSGRVAKMTLHPAGEDLGVCFVRTDCPAVSGLILARWNNVTDSALCTQLGNAAGVKVRVVEHVLAALAACGVDNAIIEVDGDEPPILDGSAAPLVELIQRAGVVAQHATLQLLVVRQPIEVRDGERFACLLPSATPQLEAGIAFPNPPIGVQHLRLTPTLHAVRSELVSARTFGFAEDRERLMQRGLARGAALTNTVVIHQGRVLNAEGLRHDDEFIRHKLLDVVGDLSLAGAPVLAHYVAYQPGHALTAALLRKLFCTEDAWMLRRSSRPAQEVTERPRPQRALEDWMHARRTVQANQAA